MGDDGGTIRPADVDDLPWLREHEHGVTAEVLAAKVAAGQVYVGTMGGAPAGWLRYGLFWDCVPFMNMLYVLAPFRRQGIGRQLVSRWEQDAGRAGYPWVLTSTQSDEAAQHFYRRLGYQDCGVLLLPGEAAELVLRKQLDGVERTPV